MVLCHFLNLLFWLLLLLFVVVVVVAAIQCFQEFFTRRNDLQVPVELQRAAEERVGISP